MVLLLQARAREIGFALGRRAARAEASAGHVGMVATSMLGLLACVLGLILAYAGTHFRERRQGTPAEAQSVCTFLLVIIDRGAPRAGRIRTEAGPLLWTTESFTAPPR